MVLIYIMCNCYIYIYIAGLILESKGMRAIFQKNGKKKKKKKTKKGKILENLGKNVQNLNYFEK